MNDAGVVVLTTTGNEADAKRIARELLERRLVACVQISRIESLYWWEGKIAEEEERLLVMKTTRERMGELERLLHEIHPYTVPELVVLEATHVAEPYARWLSRETGTAGGEVTGRRE